MKLFNLALAAAAIAATSAPAMAVEHLKSVNPAYIDNSIPAGDDFYNHVNKGWMEAHPLTPEYARFGIFNILADSAEANVKEIVLGLGATNPEKGTNAFKVWTLYSQGMDSVRRNAEGAAPILDDLKKIENTTQRRHEESHAVDAQVLRQPLLQRRPDGGHGRQQPLCNVYFRRLDGSW